MNKPRTQPAVKDPMTDLASKIHDLIVDSGVRSYEAVGALQLCQAVWNDTYREKMFAHNIAAGKLPPGATKAAD